MTQNTEIERATAKEMSATARWGFGILIALFIQTGGFIWWQSSWQATTTAQINQNAKDINSLKQGAAVILTREQLDDILQSRDIRLDNIEKSMTRIEQKIDRMVN